MKTESKPPRYALTHDGYITLDGFTIGRVQGAFLASDFPKQVLDLLNNQKRS